MKEIKASIIIPTRGRVDRLKERLPILIERTPEFKEHTEIIFAVDVDDKESYDYLTSLGVFAINVLIYDKNESFALPCDKWNRAATLARGKWLVTVSDDCIPEKEGWLTRALETKNYGFLALPDGVTGDRNKHFTPLYMTTRPWLKKWNGGVLVLPMYKSWYSDIETCWRAKNSFTYIVAWDSVLKQVHPEFNSTPNDSIYQLGVTRRAADLKMFESRKKLNFPDDFEGVL